jgi:hypothetical protein
VWGAATGAVGVFVAMDGAAGFGSLHAASVLGIDAGSAPVWFPLALMPGRTVRFGGVFGAGTLPFGPGRPMVPTFHGSDLLLGNISAMVGPLLLCSVFLMAQALRATPVAAHVTRRDTPRVAAWIAILAGVAVGARLSAVTPDPSVVFARIGDNSAVFGFGFAADAVGRAVLILVVGLCLIGLVRRGAMVGQRA